MNATGPEGKGPETGRGLGMCKGTASYDEAINLMGVGLGKRRNSNGGTGLKRRFKYNQNKPTYDQDSDTLNK